MSRDGTVTRRPNLIICWNLRIIFCFRGYKIQTLVRGALFLRLSYLHIFLFLLVSKNVKQMYKRQKSSGSARVSTRANYKFLNLHFVFSLLFYSYHLQFVANKQYLSRVPPA
jgi:hypothetical protein